jgi:hypothetical protein
MSSRAIISLFVAQTEHHARVIVRPRIMTKDSVSIVIFVCFAMTSCFLEGPEYLKRMQLGRELALKSFQSV